VRLKKCCKVLFDLNRMSLLSQRVNELKLIILLMIYIMYKQLGLNQRSKVLDFIDTMSVREKLDE